MKRLLTIILLPLGIVGAFMFYTNRNAPTEIPVAYTNGEVQSESTEVAISTPTRLIISKLGINADIEDVGLDTEKRMDVPKEDTDVAWYKFGAKPGEMGSAVVAGHFDTKTGGQAVFYRLKELDKGDEVQVEDANGLFLTFVVTDVSSFKDDTFPISLVFAQDDAKRLNLITCAGTFDSGEQNYSDRTVVFTQLRSDL